MVGYWKEMDMRLAERKQDRERQSVFTQWLVGVYVQPWQYCQLAGMLNMTSDSITTFDSITIA
jgi:hypothetical protein